MEHLLSVLVHPGPFFLQNFCKKVFVRKKFRFIVYLLIFLVLIIEHHSRQLYDIFGYEIVSFIFLCLNQLNVLRLILCSFARLQCFVCIEMDVMLRFGSPLCINSIFFLNCFSKCKFSIQNTLLSGQFDVLAAEFGSSSIYLFDKQLRVLQSGSQLVVIIISTFINEQTIFEHDCILNARSILLFFHNGCNLTNYDFRISVFLLVFIFSPLLGLKGFG